MEQRNKLRDKGEASKEKKQTMKGKKGMVLNMMRQD